MYNIYKVVIRILCTVRLDFLASLRNTLTEVPQIFILELVRTSGKFRACFLNSKFSVFFCVFFWGGDLVFSKAGFPSQYVYK